MSSPTLPPILTVPPEVLAHIFILGKHALDAELLGNERSSRAPLFVIQETCAAVCSNFRDVACGTALLWNTVSVCPTSTLDKVVVYCRRSAPAPLNVRVHLEEGWTYRVGAVDKVYDALAVIVGCSGRWQRLTLVLGEEPSDREPIAEFLCRQAAPLLEHLTLAVNFKDVSRQHPLGLRIPILSNSLDLSFTRFRGLAVHFFRPPLDRLTILHFDHTRHIPLTYEEFKELLTASRNLECLSLYGTTITPGWPAPNTGLAIHLPSLKSLRVWDRDGSIYAGFLATLDAPALRSVTIHDMHEDDLRYNMTATQTFPPLSQVKHLAFTDFDLSEVAYRSIFRIFPDIEVFHCPSSTIGSSKAYCLLRREGSMWWPNLHTLRFAFDAANDPGLLPELLDIRGGLGLPPIRFQFVTQDYDNQDVTDWMESAAAEGQSIDVQVISVEEKWPGTPKSMYVDREDNLFV